MALASTLQQYLAGKGVQYDVLPGRAGILAGLAFGVLLWLGMQMVFLPLLG